MITIGVPAESEEEPRIGLSPETAKKLVKIGAKVLVRPAPALRSHFSDEDYKASRGRHRQKRRRGRQGRRYRVHRAAPVLAAREVA